MATNNKNAMVRCIDCKHGTFMRWFQNPIICQCGIYGERFVAESRRLCEDYVVRTNKVDVKHFDRYE